MTNDNERLHSHAPQHPALPGWRRAGHVLLVAWAALALLVSAALARAHVYSLPAPPRNSRALAHALAGERQKTDHGRWLASHVLYADCRCSRRIMAHLVARGARRDMRESILLVGDEPQFAADSGKAGYHVSLVTASELEQRYHIEAAPLLLITDPQDALRYVGGYTLQQQGDDLRDSAIIDELQHGRDPLELPLFGCAVSRSLQNLLDPFGIRYRSAR